MIVLGSCDDCTTCGNVACDQVVILIGNGLEPANALSALTYGEGGAVSITVARLAEHEYGYHGTPADFETIEGYPPPVADGSFYLDWDTGSYWLNTGGVFAIDTPPDHGNGTLSADFEVQLTECGCPHMWTGETVTASWADGDTANKTITLTPPAHSGTVPFWTCPGSPFLGEWAELAIVSTTAGTGGCVTTGYGVTLIAVCGHTITNSGWGTGTPYQLRKWGGLYQPSSGQIGFRNEEYYLREEETTAGTTSGDSVDYKYAKEFAEEGDIVVEDSSKESAVLSQFSRPVSLTVPVMLPVVQTGLPALTPGNTNDFSLQSGRGFEGQNVFIFAALPFYGNITYEWKKNGSVVASGSSSTPTTLSYTLPNGNSADSGSYTLEVTHNPPVITDPLICDSSEIVILDQTLNSISDSSVNVDGSGGGETWQWLGSMSDQVESDPFAIAADRLADAKLFYADGNIASFPGDDDFGHYGWNQVSPDEWTWRIRASYDINGFIDPGFDPTKTYEFTGADLPSQPFNPADWTEIADTGYDYQVVTSGYTQALGASGITSAMAGTSGYGGWLKSGSDYFVYSSTVDATRSASGSPYPYKVEIRILDYEDGVLISTGAWIDITDTVYDVQPVSLEGAGFHKKYDLEFQLTPLAGSTCDPTVSPVFVCHPGLTC